MILFIDWREMKRIANSDTTAALNVFHSNVLAVLEKLVPAKKKKTKVKSKSKLNKMRRTIWRRIARIKEKIREASSIQKLSSLIQRKRELEEQLCEDYSAENAQQEDEAIFNIKSNPNIPPWTLSRSLNNGDEKSSERGFHRRERQGRRISNGSLVAARFNHF